MNQPTNEHMHKRITVMSLLHMLIEQRANLKNRLDHGNEDTQRHYAECLELNTLALEKVQSDYLPSGSGFNAGTMVSLESSRANVIVLAATFDHLHPYGSVFATTEHVVKVTPSFGGDGFNLTISGRDVKGIKSYIHDVFSAALTQEVEHPYAIYDKKS